MQDKLGNYGKRGLLEIRVWLRLLTCVYALEKPLRRLLAEEFDTTLPRFDVLSTLDHYPNGQTMGQLSRLLLVSNGNVTTIVKKLKEDGYVITQPDPHDRRSAIVSLSEHGRERFREMANAHNKWIREALSDFPREQQIALYDLLALLKSSVNKDS